MFEFLQILPINLCGQKKVFWQQSCPSRVHRLNKLTLLSVPWVINNNFLFVFRIFWGFPTVWKWLSFLHTAGFLSVFPFCVSRSISLFYGFVNKDRRSTDWSTGHMMLLPSGENLLTTSVANIHLCVLSTADVCSTLTSGSARRQTAAEVHVWRYEVFLAAVLSNLYTVQCSSCCPVKIT